MSDHTLPPNFDFDRKLIAAQPVDTALRQRYEQEMKAMLETPLNPTRKTAFTLSVAVSATMAAALTMAAVTSTDRPAALRIGLGLGALYAAGWVVMGLRVLRHGSVRARTDSKWMTAWPWVFAVALMTVLLIATGRNTDSVRSVWMLVYGLTFLLMASMFVVRQWIDEAGLRVEERLLETQLRIAELAEQVQKRG